MQDSTRADKAREARLSMNTEHGQALKRAPVVGDRHAPFEDGEQAGTEHRGADDDEHAQPHLRLRWTG